MQEVLELIDKRWGSWSTRAVMCGAGHNQRMILARLRALYCLLIAVLAIRGHEGQPCERGEAELPTAYC